MSQTGPEIIEDAVVGFQSSQLFSDNSDILSFLVAKYSFASQEHTSFPKLLVFFALYHSSLFSLTVLELSDLQKLGRVFQGCVLVLNHVFLFASLIDKHRNGS